MKSYRKELWFEVPTRRALINITPEVTLQRLCSSMTMNRAFIMIMKYGLKNLLPMNLYPSIGTT